MIAGTNRNRLPKRQRPKLAPSPATPVVALPLKPEPLYRVVLIRLDGDTVEFVEERFRTEWKFSAETFVKEFNENPRNSEPLAGPRKLLAVIQPVAVEA